MSASKRRGNKQRRNKKQASRRRYLWVLVIAIILVIGVVFLTQDSSDSTADSRTWQSLPLTNVRTGETFTLADYQAEGKNVVVKLMSPT